ncbi:FK506-binding protein 15 [Bufo gargarizans]|uniref:FK506-binding protein 15 n=1 Tax=Bufo gargarizans TaxID=30331 RepID=UPI001CF3838F|nr:FK506-binding protein 15 [Bufo gargarizans]
MFAPDEEDADFLSPTGGAKLASLFGIDQSVSAQGNESFQYTAPKQPKKGAVPAGTKPPKAPGAGAAPSVLYATAVHAYKYVTGQYVKQGKFGAAVLGNHTTKEYRILLYISQQQPVTTVRIHPGFVFTVQLNNYAAFYDDQRQSWSIMFESETSAVEFSKQVCLAKSNSAMSIEAVVSQDLLPGDGQAAEVGDLMEVAYTGWLLQNHGIGQMFDSNVQKDKLLRLKLGSGKVIKAWEDGMLGMKKGGKRLLVIPPALGYGSQGLTGRIPANATLVFEVEVKRMKQKEQGGDRQSVGSRDSPVSITDSITAESLPQPPTSVPPKPGDPDVRAKSNSISEQLANPDLAKAKLISRMARMGQPMLPFLAGSSPPQPDSSDSEMEDPHTQRISPHPAAPLPFRPTPQMSYPPHIAAPAPQHQPVPGLPASSAALLPMGHLPSQAAPGFQPYTGIQYTYQHNPASQLQPVGPVYPAPVQQPATYQGDVTSFLMTEARQQSTEIRMAIGKVIDKIDNLASRVDNIHKENSAGASHLLPGISSITMESAMIMNNIQRIIQENERLKQEVLEKSSRIEEQNVKIGELINRNQRYVEQSNMLMEQRNDSLNTSTESTQAKMLHAMQEKVKVAEDLASATGQLSRLQLEVAAYQKKEMDLRTQLAASLQEAEKCRVELSSLQAQLIEMKETSEQTKNRAKTEKDSRRSLELRLTALEEEISDLKIERDNLEKSLSERKKKSQQERQRADEEQEELRRTFQEEIENLRRQLKKSREQATAEQLSSSSSRELEEQVMELQDQVAQLQPLRDKCAQLQNRITSLNEQLGEVRAREGDLLAAKRRAEEKLSRLQEGAAQLEPLRLQCSQLQAQVASLTQQLGDAHVLKDEGRPIGDPAEEVKKIMNGVFQSLRKEFDLEESYSGRAVLGTIMSTIKATTLQLLKKKTQDEQPAGSSSEEEEEEEEDGEEEEDEGAAHPEPHVPTGQTEEPSKTGQTEEPSKTGQTEEPSKTGQTEEPSKTGQTEEPSKTGQTEEPSKTGQTEEPSKTGQTEEPSKTGQTEEPSKTGQTEEPSKTGQTEEPSKSKEEVNGYPNQEASTAVEEHQEEEVVKVIEEDLDTPSALVHMVSSDLPESSIVTHVEEVIGESRQSRKTIGNDTGEDLKEESEEPKAALSESKDSEDSKLEDPPPLGSDEESSSPLPPKEELPALRSMGSPETKGKDYVGEKTPNVSLADSDGEDLFEAASPATKEKQQEEEEEELSMKGRPPPAPLFGDDDEEDDLDWLG